MNDEPEEERVARASMPATDVPTASASIGADAHTESQAQRRRARARVLRRTLMGLSFASGIFALGAFAWRRTHHLPEVRTPAFVCVASARDLRPSPVPELEVNLGRLAGFDALEVTEAPNAWEALVFAKDKVKGKALRAQFYGWPAHEPWNVGPEVEAEPRYVAIVGGRLNGVERRSLAELGLRPELQMIPGVVAVDVCGGLEQETWLHVQNARMKELGILPGDITGAFLGGTLRGVELKDVLNARVGGAASSAAGNTPPTLASISKVELVHVSPACHASRGASEDVVLLRVSLGANGEGTGGLQKAIESYEQKSPPGVHLRIITAPRLTQIHLRIPSASPDAWRTFDQKVKTLTQAPDAYVLGDSHGLDVHLEMPEDDGRKPLAYERFLRTELSRSFGCVYSAHAPALRIRLTKDATVLEGAKGLLGVLRELPGVLSASIVSPSLPPTYLVQRPRIEQLGLRVESAREALVMATAGYVTSGNVRVKLDEPFERATLTLKAGESVPLRELFQPEDRSDRTALRVDGRPAVDLCITSESLSPEELAERVVPPVKARGFGVVAEQLVVR